MFLVIYPNFFFGIWAACVNLVPFQNFSEDAGEVLPLFNKTSQAKYQIGTMVQDWNVAGSTSRPIWS